ncbi:hypothetical protein AG4045_018635 [Apium graveolens]|uniref:Uncharacterized protein n=1 Tax=Apium graveolens TaxID=4045 RepID=A0A6L5B8G2_APIGR|nr:hypothetical protein AG4045_018635 [Apium graveolens]
MFFLDRMWRQQNWRLRSLKLVQLMTSFLLSMAMEDLNASNSAYDRGSAADRLHLLGTQHESFNADGDIVDNDLDPALLEEINRLAC